MTNMLNSKETCRNLKKCQVHYPAARKDLTDNNSNIRTCAGPWFERPWFEKDGRSKQGLSKQGLSKMDVFSLHMSNCPSNRAVFVYICPFSKIRSPRRATAPRTGHLVENMSIFENPFPPEGNCPSHRTFIRKYVRFSIRSNPIESDPL